MTEDDIDFRGVLTDAAAAGFAGGEFDCVGVFAPFWLTALEREGSHEVFSSADFPVSSPTTSWPRRDIVDDNPRGGAEARRRLVPDARIHGGEPGGSDRDHGRRRRDVGRGVRAVRRGHDAVQRRRGPRRLPARRRHDLAPVHGRADQPVPRRLRASPKRRHRSTACSTPASPRTGSTGWATERQRQDVDSTPTMAGHVVVTRFGMFHLSELDADRDSRDPDRAADVLGRESTIRGSVRLAGSSGDTRPRPSAGRHLPPPRRCSANGSGGSVPDRDCQHPRAVDLASTVWSGEGFSVPTMHSDVERAGGDVAGRRAVARLRRQFRTGC